MTAFSLSIIKAILFYTWIYCLLTQQTRSTAANESVLVPYYISPNRFDFSNADLFCRVRCSSELASIHDQNDYEQSVLIINNGFSIFHQNKDVWCGLNDMDTEGEYKYKDKSTFAFDGTFPWKPGSPNNANPWNGNGGQDCIEYSHSFHYLLDDAECNNQDRILCNKCDSIINKYVIINELLYYDDAETFCKENVGTNLASLHSFDDHNEALFLCERYDYDCWIGLILNEGIFEWTDNTQFDYGNDISIGVYPWDQNQPNTTSIQHSIVHNSAYPTAVVGNSWSIVDKTAEKHYFLCSLPSALCDDNTWHIIHGNDWEWNECALDINSSDDINDMGILYEKQWINSNNELIIEYMLKITEIYAENEGNDEYTSNSGILLFNFESICNYYEIGILYLKKDKYNIYIGKWMNGVYRLLQTKSINDEFDVYYILRIIVIDKYKFGIYVNGEQYIDVMDTDRVNNIINPSMSGYIGLINNHLSITAKSIYVSGSAISVNNTDDDDDNALIEECEAIIQLQHMLNNDIEYTIEYGVITSIVIHIKTTQLNALNITNFRFNNILSNITMDLLNQSIKDIDANCILENTIKMEQMNDTNTLRINIIIYVCTKQTQSILTVEFNQNLQRDFIQKVNDESDENEVFLSVDTEDVEVQVSNTDRMVIITPSTTMDINSESNENTLHIMNFVDVLMRHKIWTIVSIVAICVFCIMFLIFCRKCNEWKTVESKRDEIGGTKDYNDHSIPIMELNTDSLSVEDENTPFKYRTMHKQDSLIVRYPGDDNMNNICEENELEALHEMNSNYIGPGFSASDKPSVLTLSEDEFVIESDSDENVTRH